MGYVVFVYFGSETEVIEFNFGFFRSIYFVIFIIIRKRIIRFDFDLGLVSFLNLCK